MQPIFPIPSAPNALPLPYTLSNSQPNQVQFSQPTLPSALTSPHSITTPNISSMSTTYSPAYRPLSMPVRMTTNLPPGWEHKVTPDGRDYYVNHSTKSTQWERPR